MSLKRNPKLRKKTLNNQKSNLIPLNPVAAVIEVKILFIILTLAYISDRLKSKSNCHYLVAPFKSTERLLRSQFQHGLF